MSIDLEQFAQQMNQLSEVEVYTYGEDNLLTKMKTKGEMMSDLNIQDQEDKYEEFYCNILIDIIDECKQAMQDLQAHGVSSAYAEEVAKERLEDWNNQQPDGDDNE